MLMSAFSLVALTLTAAGIFGLLAQMVAQRTREIGIRMALGATRAQVLGLITARGLTLTSAGVVLGVSGALALTPVLKSLLFEVTPSDPVSYAAIVALIAVVALAACSLPARMATKVNPADALRVD
jgi:ABC-type antimicrobial peptide transport system permease subunit